MYYVQPFLNVDNIRALGEFFRSALGPRGGLTLFVTSAGQMRVTSISQRLVASIQTEIQDPCAEAVLHLVKNHLERS